MDISYESRGFAMRADGTRVRDLTAIMQALPYDAEAV